MILREIIEILEEIAPPRYAQEGDAIGLQIGDPGADVKSIAVSVDVTPDVVRECARRSADLLITHHPLISPNWQPLPAVRLDVYPQSLVYQLVSAGVALYVMHTNYDSANGGINDTLAERLGVRDCSVMLPTWTDKPFKLVTFVPAEAAEAVRDAISEAGGGVIGDYSHCSFRTPGAGTFKPLPGAEPYIGRVGEIEETPEVRLEMIVPESCLHDAVTAMTAAHPYDEVACDVYPLRNEGRVHGIGLCGRLDSPTTFGAFREMLCRVLAVPDPRVAGDPASKVEKVALLGGGGSKRIGLAKSMGADVYVTGDVNHHQFLEAKAIGINVIDATHFWTERPGMVELAPRLHDLLSSQGVTVEYVDDVTLHQS